jgi:glycosyltransferase involved in cell wall biosynthesis
MPRRILIFSLAYYPQFVGGAEIAIKEITDRIPDIEFDMVTARLAPGLSSFERIGRVDIYRVGIGSSLDKFLFPLLGTLKVFNLMRARRYDLFWAMMVTFSSGAAYIVNILRTSVGRKKVPIVLTLQEGDSEDHIRSRWLGMIGLSWSLALSRTDIVTAISGYLADQAEKFGYKREVAIVPNGVDITRFSRPAGFDPTSVRAELGFVETDIVLVTASRLVLKNAVGDIVESLVHLPETVKLLVIGKGELEGELKRRAAHLKVSDRVVFLGYVPHEALPKYLHASDIFIRPSLSEGFGNSFVEAMAAGLPVIATEVGGIVDFLRDKETGLFCEVGKPEDIARKVEIYLHDRALRAEIVENAKKMVAERYGWDRIARDMREKAFAILKP